MRPNDGENAERISYIYTKLVLGFILGIGCSLLSFGSNSRSDFVQKS